MNIQEMQEFAKSFKSRKELEDYIYERIKNINTKGTTIKCLGTNLNDPTKKAYKMTNEKGTFIFNMTNEEFKKNFIFSPPEINKKK